MQAPRVLVNPCGEGPLAPHLRVVLQLDQVSTRRLLGNHVQWAKEDKRVTLSAACWIFALLARVDKPISAGACLAGRAWGCVAAVSRRTCDERRACACVLAGRNGISTASAVQVV